MPPYMASLVREMRACAEILKASGRRVSAVMNCGMENEAVYRSADEIPDDAGYFSLVIAKEQRPVPVP